jgi:hypothetical protein
MATIDGRPVSALDAARTPLINGDIWAISQLVNGSWTSRKVTLAQVVAAVGQQTGAILTVNGQTGTVIIDASHIDETTARLWLIPAERTKLAGIAAGATVNALDAALRDRTTHTGEQAITTITGLLDALGTKQSVSAKGLPNGYAALDADGLVPASQLPTAADGNAVDSVNGQTGVVVLDAANIEQTTVRRWLSNTEQAKLASVSTGATANATDAALRDRSTHTGTQLSTTVSDFNEAARDAVGNAMSGVGNVTVTVTDLADTIVVSTTATVNATDAALRDRTTHTGAQAISTITNLQAALDAIVARLDALEGSSGSSPSLLGTGTLPFILG